jgi:hypothetical protein
MRTQDMMKSEQEFRSLRPKRPSAREGMRAAYKIREPSVFQTQRSFAPDLSSSTVGPTKHWEYRATRNTSFLRTEIRACLIGRRPNS